MRLALIALVFAACAADMPSITVPDAGTAPDAGTSTPADAGSGLTFRLRFVSDVPESIFLQESGYSGTPEWITVLDAAGNRVEMFTPCEICACDSCDNCPVCGAALPTVFELAAPGSHDLVWNARVFPRETCGNSRTCYRAQDFAAGAWTAHFCWGTGSEARDSGDFVKNPTCVDVPFTYPVASGLVEHLVDHGG